MRKKPFYFFFFLLLIVSFFGSITTYSQPKENVVWDEAALFSKKEQEQLVNHMTEISKASKATLMIVTSDKDLGEDPRYTVDRTLGDYIGNDENGILYYLDMKERKVYLSTSGNMIHYFTDERIEEALDAIYDEGLAEDHYYNSAVAFINEVIHNYQAGIPKGHYTVDETTGKITFYKTITKLEGFLAFLVASIVGAFIYWTTLKRYQLKKATYSYPYQTLGKLDLTAEKDTLVHSFVTTRKIPKNTGSSNSSGGSTTHSSGGGSFGGGSRSF